MEQILAADGPGRVASLPRAIQGEPLVLEHWTRNKGKNTRDGSFSKNDN